MKQLNYLFLVVVFSVMAFAVPHKYYVSITEIDFVEKEQSVQIISRIFIDDLEKLMRQRFDNTLRLGKNESSEVDFYLAKYLQEKMRIEINGAPVQLKVLGKQYDDDLAICFIEILNVNTIKSFQISNQVLMDVYPEQQNIVRVKVGGNKKSLILTYQNDKGLLKFN
ncbi:DUF6702 family protein [Formosa sp. A9]|uniref:DUF6702 family protein n=1 Tax=Formosa sp. A9 TaxID=3442641 RepID=UPI003EBE1ED3